MELKKFSKYTLVGMLGTIANWIITYSVTEYTQKWFFPLYCTLTTIQLTINYYVSQKYVFQKEGKFYRYFLTFIIFYALNILTVYILQHYTNLHYMLIIIGTTGTIFIGKYFVYDKLVFREAEC